MKKKSSPRKTTPRAADRQLQPRARPARGHSVDTVRARDVQVLPPEDDPASEAPDKEPDETEMDGLAYEDLGKTSLPAQREEALPEPTGTALSPTDPLRRYMAEVRNHPLLSPEDEVQLVQRMQKDGSIDAAKQLVQANLRLVVKIAMEYRSMYTNLLDLIQEGNIGLMKAVSKFDPTRGAKLSYYAAWWIRSYILKYLLDNFRLVRVGTTQAQKKLFFHLMREKERLEAQGLLAGPALLAEKLQVREKDVVEMEQRLSGSGAELSLDAPVGGLGDGEGRQSTFVDLLEDPSEEASSRLEREELLRLLAEKIPKFEVDLNEKERKILRERLLAEEPKTLQEIADQYGLTRERARQIEAKIIEKLRAFLKV